MLLRASYCFGLDQCSQVRNDMLCIMNTRMSRFSGLDDCRAISEPSSVAAVPATGSRVPMVKLFRIALALINAPPHRLTP